MQVKLYLLPHLSYYKNVGVDDIFKLSKIKSIYWYVWLLLCGLRA